MLTGQPGFIQASGSDGLQVVSMSGTTFGSDVEAQVLMMFVFPRLYSPFASYFWSRTKPYSTGEQLPTSIKKTTKSVLMTFESLAPSMKVPVRSKFPLKRENRSIYSNKQKPMSHVFHTSTTGVPCGPSVHLGILLCTNLDKSAAGHPEFYLPSDWLSERAFTGAHVLDHRTPHRPPCMICSCGPRAQQTTSSLLEDLGWVTFMVRLMRSDSEHRSRPGDKTKPQMSLTPSPDYFNMWYQYDPNPETRIFTLSVSQTLKVIVFAVTPTTIKCTALPMSYARPIWSSGWNAAQERRWGLFMLSGWTINIFPNLGTETENKPNGSERGMIKGV